MTALPPAAAARYDRQIRLWGVAAQQRLAAARVLLVGNGAALAVEVAKNLVLAGVRAVHLAAHARVHARLLAANYALVEADVGESWVACVAPRLQALNPRVHVTYDAACHVDALAQDATAAERLMVDVDVVVAVSCPRACLATLDTAARHLGVPLVACDHAGVLAYIAYDLGPDYAFTTESQAPLGSNTVTTRRDMSRAYPPLLQALHEHAWTLTVDEHAALLGSSTIHDPRRVARTLKRLRKRIPPPLLAMRVLAAFEETHGRRPRPHASPEWIMQDHQDHDHEAFKDQEMQRLRQLRHTVLHHALAASHTADTTLPATLLPDSLLAYAARPSTTSSRAFRAVMNGADVEHTPTVAVCGGLVAQDVLRILSRHGAPAQGTVVIMDTWRGDMDVVAGGMTETTRMVTHHGEPGAAETLPETTADSDLELLTVHSPHGANVVETI